MQLAVSPLPVFDKRASPKKWLLGIQGLSDHADKFKMRKERPLDNGATQQVDFFDVPLKDFEELILPVLRTVACVHCIGEVETKEQQKRDQTLGVDYRALRVAVGEIWRRTERMENWWICMETVAMPQKREKSDVKSLTCSTLVKELLHQM